ncbi:MAG TPA: lysylphosphatidylglycerol synthase transmembrane domain-containing protein [Terriglobales bacterium]|nr:lysylphosphatidylglycerol synthase transmembrane domain-containing protein [Terriglobales bacterium]
MKLVARSLRHPLIRIAGSVAILGLLLMFVPLHKLGTAMRKIPPSLWFWVVAGYLVTHLIGVMKWRLTLRLSEARLTFSQATRCYFAGLFGTVFLPSIVGGDVVRMGLAFRIHRNRAGVLLGSLVDRLLDIVALGVVAAVGALLLPGELEPRHRRIFAVLAVMFAVGIAGLFGLLAIVPWRRLPFGLRRMLAKLRQAWRSMASRPLYVLVPLQLGILIQTGLIGLAATIAAACGLHIPFRIWLLVWPLAKLIALVPITLGGLGVREAGLTALLAPFGAPAALSVAVGLSWESIIIVGGLIAGLLSFLIGGTGFARTVLHPSPLRSSTGELTPAGEME